MPMTRSTPASRYAVDHVGGERVHVGADAELDVVPGPAVLLEQLVEAGEGGADVLGQAVERVPAVAQRGRPGGMAASDSPPMWIGSRSCTGLGYMRALSSS